MIRHGPPRLLGYARENRIEGLTANGI